MQVHGAVELHEFHGGLLLLRAWFTTRHSAAFKMGILAASLRYAQGDRRKASNPVKRNPFVLGM